MDRAAYLDRLNATAETARTELENQPTERWEFFAKASFTREVEIVPGRPLGVINVEETGIAVRSFRNDRHPGSTITAILWFSHAFRIASGLLTVTASTASTF